MTALRVVSGGQTGVDRAALDAARGLGVPCGGWCPRGRLAEDGTIDPGYPLRETPSGDYDQRTLWNVRDAEATLVLHVGKMTGGTAYTAACAREMGRELLAVDLTSDPDAAEVAAWVGRHRMTTLNVAGPRESGSPGVYDRARAFLEGVLRLLLEAEDRSSVPSPQEGRIP